MSKSLRGHCLVAAKSLRDPNFHKTVVLLLEHGDEGATGLIINRPTSLKVSHALSAQFDLPELDDVVFEGGPVEPMALLMLHNADDFQEAESSPLPGVYIGGSVETFKEVLNSGNGTDQPHFRIFMGYSGWGTSQLEGEIARGDWLVHPGCCDLLFRSDPEDLYDKVLQKIFEDVIGQQSIGEKAQWN